MLFTFSERFVFISLVAINSLFLVAGTTMLMYGIYRSTKSADVPDDLEGSGGIVSMIIAGGIFDIAVGLCGLVGALLKKRVLLLVNAGILGLVAVVNLVFCIVFPIGGYGMLAEASDNIKSNMIKLYGNVTDDRARVFTQDIDEHQDTDKCCGWSNDDGDNIYLKTPWYGQNNVNGIVRTLPDSCCGKAVQKCHVTENLLESRRKGEVFKMDCMIKLAGRVKFHIWIATSQLLFSTIMQFLVVGYLVLIYLRPTSE